MNALHSASPPASTPPDEQRYQTIVRFRITFPETVKEDPRVELMARLPEASRIHDLRQSHVTIHYDPTRISYAHIEALLQKLMWQPVLTRHAQLLCQWREESQRAQMEQLPGWSTSVRYARIICQPSSTEHSAVSTTSRHQWQRHASPTAPSTSDNYQNKDSVDNNTERQHG